MNQTKTQVPRMAAPKAKRVRPQRVDSGANSSASRMPSWADEMVAPVVGETNLLLHSYCMMRPATLMPAPVQRMARSRGSREMKSNSIGPICPAAELSSGRTPTKSDAPERARRMAARSRVRRRDLIQTSPFPVKNKKSLVRLS